MFFPLYVYAGDNVPVGQAVMSPGLNAYVYELGEKKYKAMLNTGVMNASYSYTSPFYYYDTKKSYFIMGGSFYLTVLSLFETGFYANFSLGGRDENIITSGLDFRMHFVPFWLLEVLYIKCGLGLLRYHSQTNTGKGMEIPYGAGMEIAIGQNMVINLEYVRRPVFFTEGVSVWDLMFSLGYAL
jgi:hypothetical protein